jgi:hypothetical protein
MAESNSRLGQTYNTQQQPIYPKIVPQAFVIDEGITEPANSLIGFIEKTVNSMEQIKTKGLVFVYGKSISTENNGDIKDIVSVSNSGEISIISDDLRVGDANISKLAVSDLTVDNARVLKQVSVLPEPSSERAEEIVQYVGPTDYESDADLHKYDFVRCVMDYDASTFLDSSAYLYTDFESFEPTTTYNWLIEHDVKSSDNSFSFKLVYHEGRNLLYVETVDGNDILVGPSEIYEDIKSPQRHRYCPYVWDPDYVPSEDENVLTYEITFDPENYTWKAVR